jgi:RND family efflux transporter MFP subunit
MSTPETRDCTHSAGTLPPDAALRPERLIPAGPEARPGPLELEVRRASLLTVVLLAASLLAGLAGLYLLGYLPHRRLQAEIRAEAAAAGRALPVVTVARPRQQGRSTRFVLPADIQAYQRTSIYPRASGYLKRLLVDIGDRVTEGQLLAEIEAPEIDAELNQARASVQQSQATIEKTRMDLALAQTTLDRYSDVAKSGGVAQQDLDERRTQVDLARAALNVARASLESTQAEVQRLAALQGFQKITAPFAGVITARNYDVGTLLSPSDTGAGRELFRLDRTDVLRAFVKVPQASATAVRPGNTVELRVRNYPGRIFRGEVTRSAGAIDASTRTLRVQVDVANPDNVLLAGMYGQATLSIPEEHPTWVVPATAIIYNAEGLSLALVREGRVCFQKVTAGRDLGNEMEIEVGLDGTESVVLNAGNDLKEGTAVQAVTTAPAGPK